MFHNVSIFGSLCYRSVFHNVYIFVSLSYKAMFHNVYIFGSLCYRSTFHYVIHLYVIFKVVFSLKIVKVLPLGKTLL